MSRSAEEIHVLHLDDEQTFVDLTAEMLERNNARFTVVTATSASEGLDCLANQEFDCVVSDYDMPGMDGIQVLETVRDTHPDLPFILFTGKGSEEVASDALRKGATDYLQKRGGSEQYDLLANRIQNAVERYESERSRRQWKRASETATEGVALVSEDGEYLQMNDAYADAFEESPDTLVGTNWREWYPDEEIDRFEREILPTLRETGVWEGESVGQRTDGTEFTQYLSLSMLDGGGHVCVMEDITEQKEREQKLKETTLKLETLVEAFPDVAFIKDVEGNYLEAFAGPETEPLLYEGPEAYEDGQHVTDVFDDEEADRVLATIQRAVETGTIQSLEYQLDVPSGSRWFESRIAPIDGTIRGRQAVVWVARDITERKERQQALDQAPERINHILDVAEMVVWEADLDSMSMSHRGPVGRVFGVPGENISNWDTFIDTVVHPDDREKVRQLIARMTAGDWESKDITFRTRPDTEGANWIWAKTHLLEDDQDRKSRLVGVARDITDFEKFARATGEDGWYQTLIEHSIDITALIDADGVMQYKNPAMGYHLDYESPEIVGENALEYVHPDDVSTVEAAIGPVIEGEQYRSEPYEYRFRHADGSWRWFESVLTDCTETPLDGYLVNSRGITDRKQAEKQLHRQNERLNEFASVVSHDLRNPLNVATTRLELASMECDSSHLADVADALDRMDTLIDDLLTLAQEGEEVGETQPVGLADLSADCWQSVQTATASLVTDTERMIRADPTRLRQLLGNLIRNAVEHGGPDVTVTIGDLADGFYVADDGPGIPEDKREKVLESGYSTAESETGFGLAIVKQIVDAHGWEVRITDSVDGGARFEITGVEVCDE